MSHELQELNRPTATDDESPATESTAREPAPGADAATERRGPATHDSPPPDPPRNSRWRFVWRAIRFFLPSLLVLAAIAGGIALLGLAQRQGWISAGNTNVSESADGESGTIYTCPMHPEIRRNRPGSCPICGMPLEPVSSAKQDGDSIEVDSVARRLANITTAPATYMSLMRTITVPGALTHDETRVRRIITFVDGRLERLIPDYTGFEVHQGDEMMVVYSPDLYVAQREFLDNVQAVEQRASKRYADFDRRLLDASRHKLIEQFGMTDEQVRQLEESGQARTRATIHAPIGGTVIEKLADEGQDLKAGQTVLKIADLSVVWLQLDVFPEDAAGIRYGQKVSARFKSLPGQTFTGRVAFVDPEVDTTTRTVAVRVVMENDNRLLRPGDYATATIQVPMFAQSKTYDEQLAGKWISPRHPQVIVDHPGKCPICAVDLVQTSEYGYADRPVKEGEVLTIPRSALLSVGSTALVYVETGSDRFEPRTIVPGTITDDRVVVLDGLRAGEMVAIDGTFLLDSKSQLAGHPSLMDASRAKSKPDAAAPRDRSSDQPPHPADSPPPGVQP